MKIRVTSLLLGLCLAVSVIAASPAYARSTTAFNSFHVMLPIDTTQNPYNCITESYGAVVNQCAYEVSFVFDLIVDRAVVHNVKVQNYVNGTASVGTNCNIWSYDGDGNGRMGTNLTFAPHGAETLTFTSVLFGNSIALLCNVPSGEGVGSLTWN